MPQNISQENKTKSSASEDKLIFSENIDSSSAPVWYEDKAILVGLFLSAIWGFLVYDYVVQTGWLEYRYEMTPPEFLSFIAGALSPFGFIWIAVLYFSVQRKYMEQANNIRTYLNEFTHPSAKNKLYIRSLLDDIKEQTSDLNVVYQKLEKCTGSVGNVLSDRTKELSQIANKLETEIVAGTEKIQAQTTHLNDISSYVENQTAQSSQILETNLSAIQEATKQTADTISFVSHTLQSDTEALRNTSDALTESSLHLSEELREQASLLQTTSEKARETISRQTAFARNELEEQATLIVNAGEKVYNSLSEQSAQIKQEVETQSSLLINSGESAKENMAQLISDLEAQTTLLESTAQTAQDNTDKMLSGMENRIETLENIFEEQNTSITQKDALLTRTSEKVQETFKEQNILLDQEAERIVARFRTIETTLDTYINEINAASTTAVEQISTVSYALNGKAEQVVEAGEKTRAEMLAVNEEFDEKTEHFANATTRLRITAENVSSSLVEQTERLSTALDSTTETISALQENVQTNIEELQQNVEKTTQKTDFACQKILKQAGELSDLTGALVSQAIVTETSLAQQQKYLSNASAKLDETKLSLKEQSEDLTKIAELLDERAAQSVLRLSRLLEDTINQASKITDRIGEIDMGLLNKINALDMSSQRTVIANNALHEELERHKTLLDSSSSRMATYTEEITAEIARQVTQMDISSELIKSRTEKAVVQIDEQFRRLSEDAHLMLDNTQKASAEILSHTEKAETLFNRQETSLSSVSNKLVEQTGLVATMLRDQSEQADKDLERLISRINLIEEGLSIQTKELSNASERTISQLETVGSSLMNQTDNLVSLAETAKTKIAETTDVLNEKSKTLISVSQDVTQQNVDSVNLLEKKEIEFKSSADSFIERITDLKTEIETQTESLQKQSAKSTQQSVMIRDSMQRHIIDLGDVANVVATQSRLGEASLNNQVNYLKEAAEDVMTHIRNINEAVRQNTNDLLAASSRIGFELDAMGENLRRRNEEASNAAEDSLNRSQTAALFLEEKAGFLANMTDHVINGLLSAGEKFSTQSTNIEAATQLAREQIEATGERFIVQSHQVTRISEEAQKAIKNLSVVMRERAGDFYKTAEDSGVRVRALNDSVIQIGKEFEEMSNKGVIQIDLAGQKLRSMISEVAGNSERIALEVRKSGEQFVDQSDLLSVAADEALKRLQELLTLMQENAKEIHDSNEKVSAQSIKLGGAFNRQVQALISASRSAEEYITALDKKKEEADTGKFMKDSSFIIEKLQSLGVDIARIYTPDVEENLWKRYYSGDRSAFVRHLSRVIDKNQVRKMTDLFTQDSEFREYVSRYVSEFDSILARAQENERADILTGVILGSEVGRLYMLLSRVFSNQA